MTLKYPNTNNMIYIQKATMEQFLKDGGHIIGIGGGARTVVASQGLDFWDSWTYVPGSPVEHGMEPITVTDPVIGAKPYQIAYWTKPTLADGWDEGAFDPTMILPGMYTPVAWNAWQVSQQPGAVPVAYFNDLGSNIIAMVRYPYWNGKIFLSAVDPFTEEGSLRDDALWDNRSWPDATDGYNDADSEKPLVNGVLNWMGIGSAATPIESRSELFQGYVSQWGQREANFYIDVTDPSQPIDLIMPFGDPGADLDLFLYNPSGTEVARADYGWRDPERIRYSPTSVGRYHIRVYAYSGSSDFMVKANYRINTALTGVSRSEEIDIFDGKLYRYPFSVGYGKGTINVNLDWAGDADLDVYLYNPAGQVIASATSSSNNPEQISFPVSSQPGIFYIGIYSYRGNARFNLNYSFPK
jgi:hypothetical protein